MESNILPPYDKRVLVKVAGKFWTVGRRTHTNKFGDVFKVEGSDKDYTYNIKFFPGSTDYITGWQNLPEDEEKLL